jgi:hypothetical protein
VGGCSGWMQWVYAAGVWTRCMDWVHGGGWVVMVEAVVEMVALLMGRGVGQPRLLGNMSVRLYFGACLVLLPSLLPRIGSLGPVSLVFLVFFSFHGPSTAAIPLTTPLSHPRTHGPNGFALALACNDTSNHMS